MTPLDRVRVVLSKADGANPVILNHDLARLIALADGFGAYLKADTLAERDAWWSNMRDNYAALTKEGA